MKEIRDIIETTNVKKYAFFILNIVIFLVYVLCSLCWLFDSNRNSYVSVLSTCFNIFLILNLFLSFVFFIFLPLIFRITIKN